MDEVAKALKEIGDRYEAAYQRNDLQEVADLNVAIIPFVQRWTFLGKQFGDRVMESFAREQRRD